MAAGMRGAAPRESRRSEPTPRSPATGLGLGHARPARATRPPAHPGAENLAPSLGGAGRGKWLGPGACTTRLQRNPSQHGRALHDITNVAVSRPFGKPAKQPPLPEVPAQAAAERAAKAVVPPLRGACGAAPPAPAAAVVGAPAPQPLDGDAWEPEPENVQSCAEYVPDIFNRLFHEEATFMPRAGYMDSQAEINGKMRGILIDWLIEVHSKYRLRPETLFLTANLVDRYLTRMPVARKRLQLVGVVALFVAAKFEEIDPPRIHDFVYITDKAYTKEDILVMECTMLATLSFQIVVPTPAHFLDRLQRTNRCDERHRELVHYVLELALLDLHMIRHTASHMVAAALLLSNELLGRRPAWPTNMVLHSRHTEHALQACAAELRALLEAAPQNSLQAVRRKYMHDRHHSVARMVVLPLREAAP